MLSVALLGDFTLFENFPPKAPRLPAGRDPDPIGTLFLKILGRVFDGY